MEVSVIIPTLNAGKPLRQLLEKILDQQFAGEMEIVVVDSGSQDETVPTAKEFEQVRLLTIDDFSHGRSRNLGGNAAKGKFLVFMTQDAIPADERWLENLLKPLSDPKVAAVFSRQIPRPNANPMERYFLSQNFPQLRIARRLDGNQKPNVFDVFFSNVSAATRRDIWKKYPFDEQIIMSEDQKFARDVLCAGYMTVYEPSSIVYHSHNYDLKTVFQRYFDSLYSLEEIFSGSVDDVVSRASRYFSGELGYLCRNYPWRLPYYFVYNLCKLGGVISAKCAPCLPVWVCRLLSMHKYYWDKN